MEVRLIQPRELFGPEARQAELKRCWELNERLFDSYALPEGRPTFNELFQLCEPDAINVIANSDIYFLNHEVDLIRYAFTRPGCGPEERPHLCLALSRWDVMPDGSVVHHDHRDSQDLWIFYGKPQGIDASFTMGNPGCDNALAWLIKQAGYTVLNPSKTIRTYHLHNVPWRSYGEGRGMPKMHRIQPPYEMVPCTEL